MDKKQNLFFTFLILYLVLLMQPVIPVSAAPTEVKSLDEEQDDQKDDFRYQMKILHQAMSLLYSKYEKKINARDMVYTAIKQYVKTLDPYTNFVEPKENNEMKIRLKGEYGGLGIVISIRDKLLTVISPIEDTPAARAGIEPLDRIMKIDGESTYDISLEKAVHKMRGEPGTKCVLEIRRKGVDKPLIFELTRSVIHLKTVKAKMLEGDVGYIRIINFNENTGAEVKKGLEELLEKNPIGLVLDLRSNPGGLLQAAVEVADLFLPERKLVVFTKGRIPSSNAEYYTTEEALFKDKPLVVLINHGSASASEIVSGAIRDWKRGILLGTKSFGKGSVQHIFPLFDKSSLVMTVSKYFTPSGECIHEKGITPDIVLELPPRKPKKEKEKVAEEPADEKSKDEEAYLKGLLQEQYEEAMKEKKEKKAVEGETEAKGEAKPDTGEKKKKEKEKEELDYQLKKAVELIKVMARLRP